MKTSLGVVNSDSVNLYNMMFTVGALADGLEQSWKYGIPTHLGHDRHRLIGWAVSLGIHLQPGLARLLSLTMLPETDEESKALAENAQGQFARQIEERHSDEIEELRRCLKGHLTDQTRLAEVGCIACVDNDLAVRLFPTLFEPCDKDGLVPLRKLNSVSPGVYQVDGLLLFAHQYFRRSQSRHNTLNEAFLKQLSEVADTSELDVRVALDRDMVGLAKGFRSPIELDYWWGPKFKDELTNIEDGVAVHQTDEKHMLFNGISRSEFWWYTQKGLKTFECEELRDIPSFGISENDYGCRFVHSILDPENNLPTHLDGAVRTYSDGKILERVDKNIRDSGRSAVYTKLWRIDGKLSVIKWKEMITHYFRDNHLIGEYFGGTDEKSTFRPTVIQSESNSLAEYVPWDMPPDSGIQLAISYHQRENSPCDGRHVVLLDRLTWGDRRFSVIEADTIELEKILRRHNETLLIPHDASVFIFEDMSLNLPLIVHCGEQAVRLAVATEEAVRQMCLEWNRRNADVVLTWNIGIDYEDRRVIFSYAGHVKDFGKWFAARTSDYPKVSGDCEAWIDSAYTCLNTVFKEASGTPKLDRLIRASGILQVQRRFLDPNEFSLEWNEERQALMCKLAIKDPATAEVLQSNNLTPAMVSLLTRSSCTRCAAEYATCGCSKLLDDDVAQRVEGMKIVACFWTNRSAVQD
ncbi:MAG: hypothetical protein ACKVP0_06185 [Pirellulaceae bacterium]